MATTNGAAPAPRWRVTGQAMATKADPSQGLVEGWTVTFVTAAGDRGSVFVPLAQYNAATVRAAIEAIVPHVEDVRGLTA